MQIWGTLSENGELTVMMRSPLVQASRVFLAPSSPSRSSLGSEGRTAGVPAVWVSPPPSRGGCRQRGGGRGLRPDAGRGVRAARFGARGRPGWARQPSARGGAAAASSPGGACPPGPAAARHALPRPEPTSREAGGGGRAAAVTATAAAAAAVGQVAVTGGDRGGGGER